MKTTTVIRRLKSTHHSSVWKTGKAMSSSREKKVQVSQVCFQNTVLYYTNWWKWKHYTSASEDTEYVSKVATVSVKCTNCWMEANFGYRISHIKLVVNTKQQLLSSDRPLCGRDILLSITYYNVLQSVGSRLANNAQCDANHDEECADICFYSKHKHTPQHSTLSTPHLCMPICNARLFFYGAHELFCRDVQITKIQFGFGF